MISMLKLCSDSICQPLEIIFKTCLWNGRFPLVRKKANVVPIHKKGDKQTIENCRSVLLLPIYVKIFERLLKIIYFLKISLGSDPEILASINFFQLIMKYSVLLLWGSKFVVYSLIYPKLLTKYGMMDWLSKCHLEWNDSYFRGLPEQEKVKSRLKWSVFVLGRYSRWCTTRIHCGTFVIFYISQWFIKWYL